MKTNICNILYCQADKICLCVKYITGYVGLIFWTSCCSLRAIFSDYLDYSDFCPLGQGYGALRLFFSP